MTWVKDPGVAILFVQLDEIAPHRSRVSDGTKGDPFHTTGEHVPESPPPPGNPDEEVDAGDYTHDPRNGCDIGQVFESIRASRDPRVLYMIFNYRICSSYSTARRPAWEWGPYDGDNPHTGHGHLSVRDNPRHGGRWAIGGGTAMSDKSNAIIAALANGEPEAGWPGGQTTVEPVKWRIRDEAWQEEVSAKLAELAERLAELAERGAAPTADQVATALLPGLRDALIESMPESVLTIAEAEQACVQALESVKFTAR